MCIIIYSNTKAKQNVQRRGTEIDQEDGRPFNHLPHKKKKESEKKASSQGRFSRFGATSRGPWPIRKEGIRRPAAAIVGRSAKFMIHEYRGRCGED